MTPAAAEAPAAGASGTLAPTMPDSSKGAAPGAIGSARSFSSEPPSSKLLW